jgi:hypothetical protein
VKWFIILLLAVELNGQAVEISAVVHSVISGFTISYQIKDRNAYRRNDLNYVKYQKVWRALLPFEYLSASAVGFSIAIENKQEMNFLRIVTDVAEAWIIRVNVRQWVYQLDNNRNMFNQANTTNTFFPRVEKWAGAAVKVFAMILVIGFKYLIIPLID